MEKFEGKSDDLLRGWDIGGCRLFDVLLVLVLSFVVVIVARQELVPFLEPLSFLLFSLGHLVLGLPVPRESFQHAAVAVQPTVQH